jgi:C-terminal peptidase (prc)
MKTLLAIIRFPLPLWLVAPLLTFTLFFGLASGYLIKQLLTPATTCSDVQSQTACQEFAKFWQVWGLAEEKFVDEEALNTEAMVAGAINGMLDSLGDQGHTRYMTAEENARWQESLSGSFEGIGAYIGVRDGIPIIVAPIEGSPAEAAGIRAGDVILAVDNEDVTSYSTQEIVSRVRGPKGTTVKLSLRHENETSPYEVTITRAAVKVPSVSWRMLEDNIALVNLNQFAENSAADLRKALQEAKDQGASAIIFDMRNNPGGLVNEALQVASQFLPEGTTVLLREDRSGDRTPMEAQGPGVARDIPLVVLVNQNSASSAEIIAGAIQDAGRAKLIGMRTVGTGTVLTPYNIDGGGQLLLGTVQWLTPNGNLIRKQGITPDIEVELPPDGVALTPSQAAELSPEELQESGDTQLLRAIEELKSLTGR